MQRIKVLLQPKILHLLALGLILIASLLLLIQSRYGSFHVVTVGNITRDPHGKGALIKVTAAHPANTQAELAVSASGLLLWGIERAGEDAEFLAVIHQRGEQLVFERLLLLGAPEDKNLRGTGKSRIRGLAVGSQPELVAMVGLDRFGYQLSLPFWAKEKMAAASTVYHQLGNPDDIKEILDGTKQDYVPDVYLLDNEDTVLGMRSLGQRLLPLPELLRWIALGLYCVAVLAVLGALLSYKWSALVSAGKRIWDQVSKRGRKASS